MPTTIDRSASRSVRLPASPSLTSRVYEQIRNEIITCALAPGIEISEAELATRFRVSKTPVREALAALRGEGFVRTFPRRGYQIVPLVMSDLSDLFELRSVLEAGAADLAAERMTDREISRLQKLADVGYDRSVQPSLRRFIRANRDFHSAIAKAAKNLRLQRLILGLLDELERFFYLGARHRDLNVEVQVNHRRIVDALRRRDGRAVRNLIVEDNDVTRAGLLGILTQHEEIGRGVSPRASAGRRLAVARQRTRRIL